MQIRAIKQGNSLQIKEELNLADGVEIVIFINDYQLQKSKRSITWEDFQKVIGAWKNDEEITEIFKKKIKLIYNDLITNLTNIEL